jgi:N4-gp56 family major capsid protein
MASGEVPTRPIWKRTELEKNAGDQVTYNLSMQLKGKPTQGDNPLEGKEEKLSLYSDSVYIDQARHAVNAGGKMSQKRTMLNLRNIGKARLSDYFARLFDETISMYLSGTAGQNVEFIEYNAQTPFTGYANNPFVAPDTPHLMFPGTATQATLQASDKFSLKVVDRAVARAKRMGGGTQGVPQIQPAMIEGEKRFLLIIDPVQEFDLRNSTDDNGWAAIQKALATALGKQSAFIQGGVGIHNNVVMHVHENVIRFTTGYGAASNTLASRALFLGIEAGVIAFGNAGTGMSFNWKEKPTDYDNVINIAGGTMWGFKKANYNGLDFGTIAIDTAADTTSV